MCIFTSVVCCVHSAHLHRHIIRATYLFTHVEVALFIGELSDHNVH